MLSTLNIILQFVFQLATMLFLVRFLLQVAQADFYNPISQAVVKGSDPICQPLRRLLPIYRNFDFASLLVAWLVAAVGVLSITYVNYSSVLPIVTVAGVGFIKMLLVLIQFYQFTILIVVIASFLAQGSYHPALALLHQLLEPLVAPIRKVMPSFGPIDLSPMVLILIIFLVENMLSQLVPRFLG